MRLEMINDKDRLNVEMPADALAAPVTPSGAIYRRSNFSVPVLDETQHRIVVDGEVASPFTFGLADLLAMPRHTVTVTTECAGNGRRGMRPLPPGEPWGNLAVSTVRWSGVPLGAVARRAGILREGAFVVVEGEDAGPREDAEGTVRFSRGLALPMALEPDVLLATHMNDQPLDAVHGAPVRLVVPGWYGMANVKWVRRIEVSSSEFTGYFQRQRYVYDENGIVRPVTRMRVKSLIVAPADGAVVGAGEMSVWGWAWSGEGAIARVELSAGDGWHAMSLSPATSPHAWTRWHGVLHIANPGRFILRSRAADTSGNVQPDEAPWNRLGYGNNAIQGHVIDVT